MGQFKPMVKMYTDEPSVILKLKKGGKVKSKAAGQSEGFKSMASNTTKMFEGAADGVAPKKPSMAERRKAMNPNLYAKGGKVAHKQMGGAMSGGAGALGGAAPMGSGAAAAPAGGAMNPMTRAALAGMNPRARANRAAMLKRALMGMKKGGSTAAECARLEKELEHHKALSASKAHGKASGGKIDSAETKTTLKNSVKPFAKTKMDTAHKDKAHGTGEVKEGKPGGYKMGGSIMGNEGPFENTKMHTAGKGKTGGTTGGVRMGNAGGYKDGGKAMKYASGGAIDSKMTRTTVEGGDWENRPANTSKPGKTDTTTGEVKESNGGGYKKGGSAKKAYATGGQVVDDGKAEKMPRHFVSRPVANSLQSGTFKRGGKVKMADGGSSSDDPAFAARKLYAQTYAKHGKTLSQSKNAESKAYDAVLKQHGPQALKRLQAFHRKNEGGYAEGGNVPSEIADKMKTAENERASKNFERMEREENETIRNIIPNAMRRGVNAVKDLFKSSSPPAGSVTKTEKSVTVSPGKRRGGSMKC
jgi:hypothetical protein